MSEGVGLVNDPALPGLALVFGRGTARTHLVHVVRYSSGAWHRALAFRDALRADAQIGS